MTSGLDHIDPSDHVVRNRAQWDAWAPEYKAQGRSNWEQSEPSWGIFSIPESEVGLLPASPAGLDVVELGCGTGYVSSWLARRGAHAVGVDNSRAQLDSARELQAEFGLEFPLLHASAEQLPLRDESFDFAVSEYGASIWCDPYRWIPEAARVLRPGGHLAFLVNSALVMCCVPDDPDAPATDRLLRSYLGMHRFEWPDDESVEFHLAHGDMIRLLHASGFELEDLIEVAAPEGATTRYPFVTAEWARRWPCEEVWKVRKSSG